MIDLFKYEARCGMLLFMASALSVPIDAGELIVAPEVNIVSHPIVQVMPTGSVVSGANNVRRMTKGARSLQKMRCWQNGELILEQKVIVPKYKVTDMRLLRNPESGADIMALDFKNTFCFIK